MGLLAAAAACGPGPLTPTPANPSLPTSPAAQTAGATAGPAASEPAQTSVAESAPPAALPAPTPTPAPRTLVVCQKDEPLSLYLYGDNTLARAGIFEALFDGPIDAVGYAYQPVILQALPSLENGGLTVTQVEVHPGDRVVDALTGAVTPLGEHVELAQLDGSRVIYSGDAPARTLQMTAVFKLKPGLLWSDGQPLTAEDSVFSFEVASSADTPVSKIFVNRTARYEAGDSITVRWTGLPGWLDTNYFLRFWTPLPKHRFGSLGAAALRDNRDAAQHPLGWGPFQLAEWQPGDHLVLTRNPNYFRAAEGLPRLDRVVFRFGLDASQVLSELQAGRCDVGEDSAGWQGRLDDLLAARGAGWLRPQFVSDAAFEHLDFDIAPVDDYKRPAGNDLFQDVRVRQAFAYCLDRQALVSQLLDGLAEVPNVYLPAEHPFYAKNQVTTYAFNPPQGQELLKEAGWVDRGGDGILEKDGRKLSLDYISGPPDDAFQTKLMQQVQAQLRANCGIDLHIKLLVPEVLTENWPKGVLFGRRFDVGEFPWRTGIEPPCDLYVSDAVASTDQNPGGANDTGYSSPAFDRACHAALTALDQATRQAMHAQAETIFSQDLPSLPLFFRVKAGAARPGVKGYRLDSTAQSDLWNIEQMDVATP